MNAIGPPLQRLSSLVIKDAVGLGGLSAADHVLAMALCWRVLPDATPCTEPDINRHLKAALAGPALWLGVDHVELRRWLVDTGWLQRDGWGREYRRVAADSLRPDQRSLADALAAIDPGPWVAAQRGAHQAAREARRRNWQGSGSAAQAQGPAS